MPSQSACWKGKSRAMLRETADTDPATCAGVQVAPVGPEPGIVAHGAARVASHLFSFARRFSGSEDCCVLECLHASSCPVSSLCGFKFCATTSQLKLAGATSASGVGIEVSGGECVEHSGGEELLSHYAPVCGD